MLQPLQNFKKYNRESGRKTLIFVGILIALIAVFAILSLILIVTKPKVLTSSIDQQTVSPSN